MSNSSEKLGLLSPTDREAAIKKIIAFFQDERDEEIGFIAAEAVLDFFLEEVGPEIREQTIEDLKKTIVKNRDDLDFEIDMLLDK